MKLVIVLEGGVVTQILTDTLDASVRVYIADLDTEGIEEDRLAILPDGQGTAHCYGEPVDYGPIFVRAIAKDVDG